MMTIMRYPAHHKAEVRAKIVATAARRLRAQGLSGVSIPELMKEAGLTHGGFYVHFPRRDALVAAAVEAAGAETGEEVFRKAPSPEAAMARYLSAAHVAHPEAGCVLAALGTEARGQAPEVQEAFARVARGFVRLVGGEGPEGPGLPGEEALQRASTMVGALVLARLVKDPAWEEALLRAAQAQPPRP